MANIKISQLPAATTVSADVDVLPIVHSGVTQKVTPDQIVQEVLKAPGAIGETTPGNAEFVDVAITGYLNVNPSNENVILSPTGSGTVTISPGGSLTLASTSLGSMNNIAIGSSNPQSGAFTTLTSSSTTTLNGTSIPASKTLLTTDAIGSSVQAFDLDLSAIAALTGTSGYLKKTGTNTWELDTSTSAGTVTSVGLTAPTGFTVSGSPITSSGTLAISFTSGYSLPTTSSQTQWDTAYTERATWNGGSTNLVAATGRTSLGLGSIATQAADNVSITGGSISGVSGAFTTLSASSTVSGTGFSTYLASPPAIGGSSPAAGNFTTLGATGAVTLSGGTANGVAYLNGSKVLTTGSALTFDGATLDNAGGVVRARGSSTASFLLNDGTTQSTIGFNGAGSLGFTSAYPIYIGTTTNQPLSFNVNNAEQMRLTSNGLGIGYTSLTGSNGLAVAGNVGIGTSSPGYKLQIANSSIDANNDITGAGLVVGAGLAFREKGNSAGIGGGIYPVQILSQSSYSNLEIYNTSATYGLVFGTQSIERMRIDSSGTLLLRQSSNAANTSVSFNTTVQNALTLDSSGNLLITSSSGGVGYGAGAGGNVTQETSKSTAVTLNKLSGYIILNNEALAAGATATFNFNNSLFAIDDIVIFSWGGGGSGGTANYNIWSGTSAPGIITVCVKNVSTGSLSNALIVRFIIIKGANS